MPKLPLDQVSPHALNVGASVLTGDECEPRIRPPAAQGDRRDADDDDDRLLTAAQVKRRYGNASDMWLWRRLRDSSGFPKPILICGRRFWRLSALIAWERSRAAGVA
jgi:hypothetical protein